MNLSRDDSHLVLFWLLAAVVATVLAMNYMSASLVDGQFVPVGNDSFYHARRILDAAVGERGFYQFDVMIHVPEGSWLTWPWAYDYLMSVLVRLFLLLSPGSSPMAVLAYLPLPFLLINTALYTLLLRDCGLRKEFIVLALIVFAFSPTTQGLHGIGRVDHHMAELTFVLLSVWLGLRFFAGPASLARAAALGIALGVAPAFHNSLFILQLPVLIAAFVCWLRGSLDDRRGNDVLATALFAATLLALLPSATFLAGRFEFATHSWFHLYIAACSAGILVALGRTRPSLRSVAMATMVSAVLSVPVLLELVKGATFLTGVTTLLDSIVEVRSPLAMWIESGQLTDVTRYYGLLIVAAPVLIIGAAAVLARSRSPRDILLMSAVLIGLSLALFQFRLHPFGAWALPVASLWFVQQIGAAKSWPQRGLTVAAAVVVAVSLQPPLMHQLFKQMPTGLTERYEFTRPMYLALGELCAAEPGVVLAIPDDGHPIRYHTDCKVIANNFLLTRQHGEKALLANALLDSPAADLRQSAPYVKYLLLRPQNIWREEDGMVRAVPRELVLQSSPRLVREMFGEHLPEGFELLGEIPIDDNRGLAYARLVRVN